MARDADGVDDRYFVTELECSRTGEKFDAGLIHGVSPSGAPLLVRYDLDAIRRNVARADLIGRPPDMWRYREFLPFRDSADIVSLGETMTPLVPLRDRSGGGAVLVKDEGRMPTGSFKSRGIALAVTMAKCFGIKRIAMPTAGNAGAAVAAYCRRAGIEVYVFTPADTPEVTAREIGFHGAKVFLVDGLIDVCGRVVAEGAEPMGWFDMSTLKEPYRIEGKKTMGLELAEQLNWQLPDVIFYPTGGGTGLIGMWKGFQELAEIDWITGPLPRMVAVQSTGCGPIVRAFEAGEQEVSEPWRQVNTNIHGVRVPKPLGDRLILSAIYDSGGFAMAVDDRDVVEARAEIARREGLHLCPEGAACYVAYCPAHATSTHATP